MRRSDKLRDCTCVRRPRPHKRWRADQLVDHARLKGAESEEVALRVLEELIAKELLPPPSGQVRRYLDNSRDDGKGYDIAYPTAYGALDFQVKSSWRARETFLKKHPHIFCIVVERPINDLVVAEQLLVDVWEAYEKLTALAYAV